MDATYGFMEERKQKSLTRNRKRMLGQNNKGKTWSMRNFKNLFKKTGKSAKRQNHSRRPQAQAQQLDFQDNLMEMERITEMTEESSRTESQSDLSMYSFNE